MTADLEPDLHAWSALVEKETRGHAPDDLTWRTPEGIDVKPLYTAADLEGLEHLDALPGFPPFVRGPRASMYAGRPWTLRQTRVDRGEDVIVGVNRYAPEGADEVEILDIDNSAVREAQVARLGRVRAARAPAPWRWRSTTSLLRHSSTRPATNCFAKSNAVRPGRPEPHSDSQFSTRRPGTRENSRVFAVTTVRSSARACAAMSRSLGPIDVP